MELAFADREFRDMCSNDTRASRALGVPLAEKLKARLADMAAAFTVSDLFTLPGKPKELTGDRWDHMSLSLSKEFHLVFKSGHLKERVLAPGRVDWSRVRRVFIVGLEKSDA